MKELMDHISEGLEVVEGNDHRKAPWGDEFLTVCSSGIKPEGASAPFYKDDLEAFSRFMAVMDKLKEGKTKICWRRAPEKEFHDGYRYSCRVAFK